jgi:hypothetical protein
MSKITRLDIKSLIALVDDEELYNALNDENTYYWYGYYAGCADSETDAEYVRFKCQNNPIEYLIYNDTTFCGYLWANLSRSVSDNILDEVYQDYLKYKSKKKECLLNYDDHRFFSYYNNIDENPNKNDIYDDIIESTCDYALFIWNYVSKLPREELATQVFCSVRGKNETVICILDHKMRHIMPWPYHGDYENAWKLLDKWGFK